MNALLTPITVDSPAPKGRSGPEAGTTSERESGESSFSKEFDRSPDPRESAPRAAQSGGEDRASAPESGSKNADAERAGTGRADPAAQPGPADEPAAAQAEAENADGRGVVGDLRDSAAAAALAAWPGEVAPDPADAAEPAAEALTLKTAPDAEIPAAEPTDGAEAPPAGPDGAGALAVAAALPDAPDAMTGPEAGPGAEAAPVGTRQSAQAQAALTAPRRAAAAPAQAVGEAEAALPGAARQGGADAAVAADTTLQTDPAMTGSRPDAADARADRNGQAAQAQAATAQAGAAAPQGASQQAATGAQLSQTAAAAPQTAPEGVDAPLQDAPPELAPRIGAQAARQIAAGSDTADAAAAPQGAPDAAGSFGQALDETPLTEALAVETAHAETLDRRAAPMTGVGLARDAAAPNAARAMAQAVVAASPGDNRVELRLDPPELGRVSIEMRFENGVMQAAVAAERPETLDMLRRNAAMLQEELDRSGFEGAQLDFSEFSGGDQTGRGEDRNGGGATADDARSYAIGAVQPGAAPQPSIPRANGPRADGRLDIRI